jgi:hypothetical protein
MAAVIKMILIVLASTLAISACSTVKPWDRDLLADNAMQLEPAPLDAALDEHVYFSKEASSGGEGLGGGGCGCN